MTESNPPKGYCTAQVARRRLGNISGGKLRTLVTNKKIERIVPELSGQGFYKIADIDKIIHDSTQNAIQGTNKDMPGARFQPATKEDMPGIIDLICSIWGGSDTSAKRNAWIDKNPQSTFVVKSKGRIVGHIAILPLAEEKIWQMLNQDRPESFGVIDAEDVLPFEVGKPANLFLLSMCSQKAGILERSRAIWGSQIVRGIFRHIEDLGERGIPVNLVAAKSDMKDGIDLLKHIGFTQLEPKAGNKNFVVRVGESGLDFAMKHKAAYAEWLAKHEEA